MTSSMHFADRLLAAIDERKNPGIVGLDSDIERIPGFLYERALQEFGDPLRAAAEAVAAFNRRIIDAVADIVPAVKVQIAFYEMLGPAGLDVFQRTVRMAHAAGLLVIGDAKRNDIGNTSRAYSRAFLGRSELPGKTVPVYDVDALTVNAWLGTEGVAPFLEDARTFGKGLFILVKTSNPGAGEIQDLDTGDRTVYAAMADLVTGWGRDLVGDRGWSAVGAVVGATYPQEAVRLRTRMPQALFLVPGFGAQGGTADDIIPCFGSDGYGAVVNSSRDVLFAWQRSGVLEREFADAARDAAIRMREAVRDSLRRAGISPW